MSQKTNIKDTEESDACQKLFMPEGHLSNVLRQYEYRPSQLKMAQAVEAALTRSHTLLIEAATGTGKTWAYLIPAIMSRKKVLISTGTLTLQDQLFFKDLPFLAKSLPVRFRFSMMKGKSNYLCLHRYGQSFHQSSLNGLETSSHLDIIREWATQTKSGDRAEIAELPESSPVWQEVSIKGESCLGGQCPDFDRCYLTRIKQEAALADIVVVNHHLFFSDLALKENGYGELLPHYNALVFDEAHLLEEVATQYFGVSFSSFRIEDFIRDTEKEFRFCKTKDPLCFDQCETILSYSNKFFRHFKIGSDRYRLGSKNFSPAVLTSGLELVQSLERLDRTIGKLRIKSEGLAHLSERIKTLLLDLLIFLDEKRNEGQFIYWAEQRRNGVMLHRSPLDVSTILNERLFQREIPTILTSATLSAQGTFDYIKERLGIDLGDEVILESVFDFEKQTLIYLPTHLPSPSDKDFSPAISDEILRILKESRGRAFLLFTSWRNLEAVYQRLEDRLPWRLLKQGEQPKQALIETFRQDTSSVLVGTTSFWQGVDVEGEALSCVIIDKLPFASPSDPLTGARIDAISQEGNDPFSSFQIPSAILSLRQGIGRLIRNSQDRGLITILDHRITTKAYGKRFLSSLPPALRTNDFGKVVSFFKGEKCG